MESVLSVLAIVIAGGTLVWTIVIHVTGRRGASRAAEAAESSAAASGRSADAAEQATLTAEQSLDLQRREAQIAKAERERASQADVRAILWNGRRGLRLKNVGGGTANNVEAFRQIEIGRFEASSDFGTLGPNDEIDVRSGWEPQSPPGAPGAPGSATAGHYLIRVDWTTGDGLRHHGNWREFSSMH